jgi:hypothetical protein
MSTNYTTTIPETDCIGDSLATINSNFDNLGTTVLSLSTTPSWIPNSIIAFNGGAFGFRNKLINGDMRIWQRGTTFSVASYTADRWYVNASSGSLTISRSTDIPTGFQYSLNASATNADVGIFQRIESQNALDLVGKVVTVSFWAKQTTGAGTNSIGIQLYYPNTADTFTSTTSIQTISKTGTTSWAYYTATFNALPANVTNGLQLQIFSARPGGTGNSVLLVTGLQLEVGPTATPFEYRPIGTELALCQRYYQKTYSQNVTPGTITDVGSLYSVPASTGTGVAFVNWRFNPTMRTTPAPTTYNTATGTAGTTGAWRQGTTNINSQFSNTNDSGVLISNAVAVVPANGMNIHATADAEL